jgi:tetratricopeptide (TPR) repeat protein
LDGLSKVLYPVYRPAPVVTGVLDRRPGQERDATQWAIEGDLHLRAGRYNDAERAYRASLKLEPEDAVVLVDLGRTLSPLGRMREAEQAFTAALEVNPRLIAARRNRYLTVLHMGGSMQTATRFGNELLEACGAVVTVAADSVDAFANLGDAHYTLAQPMAGAAAYEAALQLDGTNSRLQEKYACAAYGRPMGGWR